MHSDHFHPAALAEDALKTLQALEREMGVTMVAVEPDPQPAELSEEQLGKLRQAEAELGVQIVAYKNH